MHWRFFQWFGNAFGLCETWNFVRYTTFPLHSRIKWKINADGFRSFLTKNKHEGEIKSPNQTQNYFSDWVILKHGVSRGSVPSPLFFLIHMYDFLLRINTLPEPMIFSDYTSVIISNKKFRNVYKMPNSVLSYVTEWFAVNKQFQNLDKTNTIKFITNNSPRCAVSTGYKKKYRRNGFLVYQLTPT